MIYHSCCMFCWAKTRVTLSISTHYTAVMKDRWAEL